MLKIKTLFAVSACALMLSSAVIPDANLLIGSAYAKDSGETDEVEGGETETDEAEGEGEGDRAES